MAIMESIIKTEEEVLDKVLNMSEKELIGYQKELKSIREMASIFCLCTGGN